MREAKKHALGVQIVSGLLIMPNILVKMSHHPFYHRFTINHRLDGGISDRPRQRLKTWMWGKARKGKYYPSWKRSTMEFEIIVKFITIPEDGAY